ncbi:MAG TPA: class I SAM-dependent methyltransferase [Vicinamibacterales bacterium]|nr:class I SAM-dependent methyltransferase [Vicinamibacterales bacterium]
MDNQDFDQYAKTKTFNLSVADTWRAAATDIFSRADRPKADIKFLDVGCGDGKYFQYLVGQGLSVDNIHGVEISRLRVERCHALGWNRAVYVEKGAPLPYDDDTFDVVNLMEVVEHIPSNHIGGVLDQIRRVLRPHGTLIVSTPNYPIKRFYDLFDAVVHRKWARFRDDPTHVTFYNHDRLGRVLGAHFARVDARCFKTGFLYRRLRQSPYTMHKMLFLCTDKRSVAPGPGTS